MQPLSHGSEGAYIVHIQTRQGDLSMCLLVAIIHKLNLLLHIENRGKQLSNKIDILLIVMVVYGRAMH